MGIFNIILTISIGTRKFQSPVGIGRNFVVEKHLEIAPQPEKLNQFSP
jgi:hypothetical protein